MGEERKIPYIIELGFSDEKLKNEMAKWDWESIMGKKGKGFGDRLVKDAKAAKVEMEHTFNGLDIDWSKILGDKELKQLEVKLGHIIKENKDDILSFINKGDIKSIKDSVSFVSELGKELAELGSSFNLSGIGRNIGAFVAALEPMSDKIQELAKEPENVRKAFDKFFNGSAMKNSDQAINKIATAMASLGVDKSAITNMKQVRTEMDKLAKKSKIKIDIDYGGLSDTDLLSTLRNKHKNQKMNLDDLLNFEWSSQLEDVANATGEKLTTTLANIVALESKIRSRTGKSPIDEYFFEDTGYDGIKDIKETLAELTKEVDKSVEETVSKLDKGVKTIQQSITEKLGALTQINVDLTLDDTNKQKFKQSIDTFVDEINANKYGEVKTVNVDLNLNESKTKTTKRGRPDVVSKQQIADTKADITSKLKEVEAEYDKAQAVLDKLNEQHEEKLKENENFDNENASHPLKGNITRAQKEVNELNRVMLSYKNLLSQMEDDETAKVVVSDWKKFSSAASNIRATQDDLLRRTTNWRQAMNDALKFKYTFKIDGTQEEYDRLASAITMMSEEKPIRLEPDIDYLVSAIEAGLSNREINAKLSVNGPINAKGGIVGSGGVIPVITSNKPGVTTTPPPKVESKPQPQTPAFTPQQTTTESKPYFEIDSDVNAIIKYVEEQVAIQKDLRDKYAELLKDAGISDSEVTKYIKGIQDKSISLPAGIVNKYGSEKIFLDKLRETKELVNFNDQLPFFDVAKDILGLKSVIENNSEDEAQVKNASAQIKSLLISSIVDSFKNYFQTVEKQTERHQKEIVKQKKVKQEALNAYNSDTEAQKRHQKVIAKQQEIDAITSNTAIQEYEVLLGLIKEARETGDDESLNSFLKQERDTLPAVKQGYQNLIKLREEYVALQKTDDKDPNLVAAREAQEIIDDRTRRLQNIETRKNAYGSLFSLDTMKNLMDSGNTKDLNDFIIEEILSKSDITQSMGKHKRTPGVTDSIKLFDTTAQQLITTVVDMVQKALSIAQATDEELSKRVQNESFLKDFKDVATKKSALVSMDRWGSLPSQADIDKVNDAFAPEIEKAHQLIAYHDLLRKIKTATEQGDESLLSSLREERKNTPDDIKLTHKDIVEGRDRRSLAYVKFVHSLDSASQAVDNFRKIYDTWTLQEQAGFLAADNKEEWIKQTFKDPVVANANIKAYTDSKVTQEALRNSVLAKVKGEDGKERNQYGIYNEITKQLKGYVFRVTLEDGEQLKVLDVGTENYVKGGKLNKPDKGYRAGSANMAEFISSLPEDLSTIADIKVYKTPSGKGNDQPSNVEIPATSSSKPKIDNARRVAEAKALISRSKRIVDESANMVTAEDELVTATQLVQSATQTLDGINSQIENITGGVDIEEYKQKLIQQRNALKATKSETKQAETTLSQLLGNDVFGKANDMIESANEEANIAKKIAENPFDVDVQKLFKGELPSVLKRLQEVVQERETVKNTMPESQEQALEMQGRVRALLEEEKTIKEFLIQWVDDIGKQRDQTIKNANEMKEIEAPKVAKDYQNKLTNLVNQSMSLSQQLEADPDNSELQLQMQNVVDTIIKAIPMYKNLLSKYNLTTKGFLGNEKQRQLENVLDVFNNPTPEKLSYMSLWGNIDGVSESMGRMVELYQKESELSRIIPTLPEDQRKLMEADRVKVAEDYNKEKDKVWKWIQKQQSAVGTGIFSGLGNSGKKFKTAQEIVLGWGNKTVASTTTINSTQELNRIDDELSTLRTLVQQNDAIQKQIEQTTELLHLAERRKVIEQELADANITSERKTELETELAANRARATELGVKSKKIADMSVDKGELQDAYITVISDLIDQQHVSDEKIATIQSEIGRQNERLGRLQADRSKKAEGAKRRTQDDVIDRYISKRSQELVAEKSELYNIIRKSVEEDIVVEWRSNESIEQYERHKENVWERETLKRIGKFIDGSLFDDKRDEKFYLDQSANPTSLKAEMMTPAKEQEVINDAIELQKKAIEDRQSELNAERERNNAIVAKRDQLKAAGKVTDEMIAARKETTDEIRREAQIVRRNTEVISDGIESTPETLQSTPAPSYSETTDTHYQNYTSGQMYQYDGGIYGIDVSNLAQQDTLNAIYELLAGSPFKKAPMPDDERKALEDRLAQIISEKGDGSLGRNTGGYKAPKDRDPTDLDIGPVVSVADDIEAELIEQFGKALPIEELRAIVGEAAIDLFTSTGDPSRKVDRHEFYEQNYAAIVEKAMVKASSMINSGVSKNEPKDGTPERELFERRNRLASDLGMNYLDFADVKYADIDNVVTEILRDIASSIFKRINKSGLELSELDKINKLKQTYTQMENVEPTPELGKQLYDLINRVFIHLGNSGVNVENSSFVQEKKKLWNTPTETKDHLYNQFADWLRQIAKEVFNIKDLPVDKFKDAIQNIWIPETLKGGKTDISQLILNRDSGIALIENRLGVKVPDVTQEETKANKQVAVDVKRIADTILTTQRVPSSDLDDRAQTMRGTGYGITPHPGGKEYKYDPWQTARGTVNNAETFAKSVFSHFVGSAREGDFSNIDKYLQYLGEAEKKLLLLDKFFESLKGVQVKYKSSAIKELTGKRDVYLQEINELREIISQVSSTEAQQAVFKSISTHMPKLAFDLSEESAKEVLDFDTKQPIESDIFEDGKFNAGNVYGFLVDLGRNFQEIESAALYFDRIGDAGSLKKVSEVLSYMGRAMAIFNKDFERIPNVRDKDFNAPMRDKRIEEGKYLRELINGLLTKNGVDISVKSTQSVAQEAEATSESLMTIGKAITIINNAIGGSTAKTTAGMAKTYANKIHDNAEAVEAAKFLYNTPDSELTSKYGRDTKNKLKTFHDAWANRQAEKPKVQVEPVIEPGAVAEEVKENVAEIPARISIDSDIVRTTLPDGSPFEGTKQEYSELMAWLSGESVEVDVKPIVQPEALDQAIDEATTHNPPEVSIVKADFADGTHFEGTEAELQEMIAILGEPISKMVEASNQQAKNEQIKVRASAQQVKNEQQKAQIVGASSGNIAKWTMPDGQTADVESEDEYRDLLSVLEYSDEQIQQNIDANKQQLAIEMAKAEESREQLALEQSETLVGEQQLDNAEASSAREAEIAAIKAKLAEDEKLRAAQSTDNTKSGGVIGAMNELAKDNTLREILNIIGEISKRQITYSSGKGNSAQDVLMRLEGLRDLSAGQDRERVMYMDLKTGAMTDSVEDQQDSISKAKLDSLLKAFHGKIDFNARVHTHGNSDNPEDQYFSEKDFGTFKDDFDKGIKTQILVSKQGVTVLDLSDVEKLSTDDLTKFGGGKSAYDALLNNDLGAKYITQAWNSITPDVAVKLLGIKGIESKYSETETRDSAIEGVLVEEAKEAAKVIQESTGRAVKTTRERMGAEWLITTEKTDAKGNKTWSKQYDDTYTKAARSTKSAFDKLDLTKQFGKNTDAQIALDDYITKYNKFAELVEKFKQNPNQVGLQKEFDELLPQLDEAEKKLNKIIATKDKFMGNKEPITIFDAEQIKVAGDSLKGFAAQQFADVSDNMAFNGVSETANGTRLIVDVLQNGFIKQYALEVDQATGQVREFMMAETALVNAFQNVNKAMKQNEIVRADIVPSNIKSVEQLQEFLENADSPIWNAYKTALAEMRQYTVDLLAVMHNGGTVSKEQEDYLMALSEKVMRLGKELQNTSGAFNNFWAQNPDNVLNLDIDYDSDNRDEIVRAKLEEVAVARASQENSAYKFSSFDNNTLQYTLTDIEGNITQVKLVWDELYKQVAMVSNKSVSAIDPMVAKIQKYKEVLQQASDNGYLMATDKNFAGFKESQTAIEDLILSVKNGTKTYAEAEVELKDLHTATIAYGEAAYKTSKQNAKLYTGTNEIKSADRQYNKILGLGGDSLDFDIDGNLTDNNIADVVAYRDAYRDLHTEFNKFAESNELNDPKRQQALQQQAAAVQILGKKAITAMQQVEDLKNKVDNSGTYTNNGKETPLGGIRDSLTEEEVQINNLKTTMLDYVQNTLGWTNLEHVKFDKNTKRLTGTLRLNDKTVADMVVQYDKGTNALYAFNQQEKESLSGIPGFIKGIKSKIASLWQYTMGMSSVYKVINSFKQGIQYIREIDSALTELKKVTNETEETYDKFLQTAAKTADKVGSTIKEVVSSTADWSRLGYGLEEAATLAESTSVLLNVSEFQSIEDATSALTSTLQAFGYTAKESMNVVDVLNEVGNNFAISSDGIATALQDSASSLMAANNSYQEAVALIAAANRVVILRHRL